VVGVEFDLGDLLQEQYKGSKKILDLLVDVLDCAHALGRVPRLDLEHGLLWGRPLPEDLDGFRKRLDRRLSIDTKHNVDATPP